MYVPILHPPSSSGSFHDSVTDLPKVIAIVALPGAAGRSKKNNLTVEIKYYSIDAIYSEITCDRD